MIKELYVKIHEQFEIKELLPNATVRQMDFRKLYYTVK